MGKEFCFVLGIIVGAVGVSVPWALYQQKSVSRWREMSDKNRGLFILMHQWTKLKQDEKKVADFFLKNHYRTVAVYGMSYVGIRMVYELRNSDVEVAYGIDRNYKNIYAEIPLYSPDDVLPEVDVIVMTMLGGNEEIKKVLEQKAKCRVLAIEDILNAV